MRLPFTLLIAEDDDDDYYLVQLEFESSSMISELIRFENGQELIDYLRKNVHAPGTSERILLLDLNMPIMDGLEVLKILDDEASLSEMLGAIAIMTASASQEYMLSQRLPGTKNYLRKPVKEESLKNWMANQP